MLYNNRLSNCITWIKIYARGFKADNTNSSPLIFLSAISMLDILKIEFGKILLSEAVYDEVTSTLFNLRFTALG